MGGSGHVVGRTVAVRRIFARPFSIGGFMIPMPRILQETGRQLWGDWDRFFFQPASSETLGVLRIATGLMLVYTHAIWGLALEPFFGSNGWQDPVLVRTFHRDSFA